MDLADLHLLGLLNHGLGVPVVHVDLRQTTAVHHGDDSLGTLGDLRGFLLLLAGLSLAHLHSSLDLCELLDQVNSLRTLGLRNSDLQDRDLVFEVLGLLDLSGGLLLEVVRFALDGSLVRFLLSLEYGEHLDSNLDVGDSGNRLFGSLDISLGDSNSQTDDLGLALLTRVELDAGEVDVSLEAQSGGTLGLLLSLSESLDLESEMGRVLLVDVHFSLQTVGSFLFSLSELDSQGMSTQMVLLGRVDLVSKLLDSGNSDDSLEVDDLSVALSSHGLGLGLLVLGLPFADVTLLGLDLRLVEVSAEGFGGSLGLLGVLSGALLVVLDGSLADSLLSLELDQLHLQTEFLLARRRGDSLVDFLDSHVDSDEGLLSANSGGLLLGNSSSIAFLKSEFSLDQLSSQGISLGARLAVADSTSQTLDGVLFVANLDSSGLVQVLVARLPDGSVSDDFLEEFNLLLGSGLLDSLVEDLDFLSDGLDRDLESSLLLADEGVSPLDLLVEPLAEGLAAALAAVVDLALADLLAGDLDDDLGPTTLEVGDLGLALGLGHLGLGREHLFLPFQFFLLDVLGHLLVHLDLDVEGAGHGLGQRLGGRTETLSDHSFVMVVVLLVVTVMVLFVVVSLVMAVVVFLVVMDLMVVSLVVTMVMSLVMVDLVVSMVVLLVVVTMELVMMNVMMVLMAVASVVDVDLDMPVMLAMMMVVMMLCMMVFMALSVVAVMLVSVSVVTAMTSLMMMSARASVFVLSVELLVVLLETPHQTLLIDMMLMGMTDPLLDLGQAAVEGSFLGHDEVCGALGESLAQHLSGVARSCRRVALGQLGEGVRRAFVER